MKIQAIFLLKNCIKTYFILLLLKISDSSVNLKIQVNITNIKILIFKRILNDKMINAFRYILAFYIKYQELNFSKEVFKSLVNFKKQNFIFQAKNKIINEKVKFDYWQMLKNWVSFRVEKFWKVNIKRL